MSKGKKRKNKPTPRQRKAFQILVENGGNNEGAALRAAGFSATTAKTPQKVTESLGWQKLLDEYLPKHDLAKAHKKLLNLATIQHISFPAVLDDSEINELVQRQGGTVKKIKRIMGTAHVWYFVPDGYSLKGGLDMAYKLNGSYAPVKVQETGPYDSMTDEEILQELEAIKKFREAQKTLSDSKKGKKIKRH